MNEFLYLVEKEYIRMKKKKPRFSPVTFFHNKNMPLLKGHFYMLFG